MAFSDVVNIVNFTLQNLLISVGLFLRGWTFGGDMY